MLLKQIGDSATVLTELMVPYYANFGGKVHGGILLGLMDKIAYACATQHSNAYCVTVSVEGVEFLHPVEVGDILTLKASVNYVGNTSMIVGMRVETKNPITGQVNHTNSCYFTMLAKDEIGNKKSVPGLIIENEVQLRRFCEGMYLKQLSIEKRKILRSDFNHIPLEELRNNCSGEKCSILF
jgi:acyl-CoA hydrolase